MSLESINPATGKVIKEFSEYTEEKVISEIEKAEKAFSAWRLTTYQHRRNLLLKVAAILKDEKRKYGEILTLEMGKPIKQAVAEVEKCALVCEYYAENSENILRKEYIKSDASESYVRFDPLGVILAVMPWNFPFWQVFRFAAPALMAGNVGILKHASNVSMAALAIEEIFLKAGYPDNVFTTLLIGSTAVGKVIEHPAIKAATLTGSEFAGQKVAEACGRKLKKTVMELGGSDPFIVLKDADINQAVSEGITSRIINNGQSCIAAKRFIVVPEIANEFEMKFVEGMKALKMCDPMEEDCDLGPLARKDLLVELDEQVKASVKEGAKILLGGNPSFEKGYYYPATIITDVAKGSKAYREEMFGPVASVIRAKDEEEAIEIANDTDFGLGASLWTNNTKRGEELAAKIEAGSVFINGMVKSDPRLPFGGIKISGYGRELSHYGIKEFVNIKTVWVK